MNQEEVYAALLADPEVAASPMAALCGEAIADRQRLQRRLERISRISDGYQNELMRVNRALVEANARLEAALRDVHTLSGFIPICSRCKRVRDDGGYWDDVENYIAKNSDAVLGEAVCPDCIAGRCEPAGAAPPSPPSDDEAEAERLRLAEVEADPVLVASPLMERHRALSLGFQKLSRRLGKISRISDGFQTQLKLVNAALAQASRTDPLTGLPNRRAMLERLEQVARGDDVFALAMIDIDHFKRVNDSFGHALGDGMLRTLAEVMYRCVRDTDFVARWGGEEFLLLMQDAEPGAVRSCCERVREAVDLVRMEHAGRRIGCTVSIGAAIHEPILSFEDTIRDADRALYAAKSCGRNTVVLSSDL